MLNKCASGETQNQFLWPKRQCLLRTLANRENHMHICNICFGPGNSLFQFESPNDRSQLVLYVEHPRAILHSHSQAPIVCGSSFNFCVSQICNAFTLNCLNNFRRRNLHR